MGVCFKSAMEEGGQVRGRVACISGKEMSSKNSDGKGCSTCTLGCAPTEGKLAFENAVGVQASSRLFDIPYGALGNAV